jgi:hypothetical protein
MFHALRKSLVPFVLLLAASNAAPAYEQVYGEHGELSDVGRTTYEAWPDGGRRFSCEQRATIARVDNEFVINIPVLPGPIDPSKLCTYLVQLDLGQLAAGMYAVTTNYSGEVTQSKRLTIKVEAAATTCTVDPRVTAVFADHPTKDAAAIAEELKDPVKRALLGNPVKVEAGTANGGVTPGSGYKISVFTYAAPANLIPKIVQLKGQGFHRVFRPGYPIPGGYGGFYTYSVKSSVIEYHNTILDHYFYTAIATEAGYIDAGGAGPGWVRTGETFPVVREPGCDTPLDAANQEPLLRPVFRFYGTPGKGPNSHFFTVHRGECHIVTQDAGWQYEGLPFWVTPPRADGRCPDNNTQPLYRLYNNRAAQNDSNHRYTTKQSIIDEMVAKGWIKEGVAMCVTIAL